MLEIPVIVRVGIHLACQGKLPLAPQFGDVDNLLKAVLDGMVKVGILADDRYVVGCECWKLPDTEDWFEITIHEAAYDL